MTHRNYPFPWPPIFNEECPLCNHNQESEMLQEPKEPKFVVGDIVKRGHSGVKLREIIEVRQPKKSNRCSDGSDIRCLITYKVKLPDGTTEIDYENELILATISAKSIASEIDALNKKKNEVAAEAASEINKLQKNIDEKSTLLQLFESQKIDKILPDELKVYQILSMLQNKKDDLTTAKNIAEIIRNENC